LINGGKIEPYFVVPFSKEGGGGERKIGGPDRGEMWT